MQRIKLNLNTYCLLSIACPKNQNIFALDVAHQFVITASSEIEITFVHSMLLITASFEIFLHLMLLITASSKILMTFVHSMLLITARPKIRNIFFWMWFLP